MKKILKSTLLFACGVCLFSACSDDNDSNPTLQTPTRFVLNTPALAANGVYDLANSTTVELTCSQPDYGFPATTQYTVQVATKQDMSDAADLGTTFTTAKMAVPADELASTLTDLEVQQGKEETKDFPMDIPVYIRVKANLLTANGDPVANTEILSNTVTLKQVHLLFSLPPVTAPEHLYITGEQFDNFKWDNAVEMAPVHSHPGVYWHLVWIGSQGIKFNAAKAWDGNEVGFAGITKSGELADQIIDGGGNIASNKPGWYLMVVTCTVKGRDLLYDVRFEQPNVYLMGKATVGGNWEKGEKAALFTVPTTADGEFVSPAFAQTIPTGDDSGIRAYVDLGFDWWQSEFMVFDKKIVYRGTGGDQSRVAGDAGQKLYLNFQKETGEIK